MEITRGRIPCGQKVVIYGVEGIGKTTLAAQFPGAVFIDTEGSTRLFDVARLPAPTSWAMLKQEAEYPLTHPGEVGTLVIDTADWAEKLCQQSVCQSNNRTSIEGWDYGKGYTMAAEEFGRLLDLLDRVTDKGVHVVITAHAAIRKMESPTEFGTYDTYELKCSRHVSPMLKEWADMVLFCNYKVMIVAADKQGKKGRGQGGQRMMYATHRPAFNAKNRHGLPDEMPMDYGQIAHLFAAQQAPAYVEPPAVSAAQEPPVNPTPAAINDAPQAEEPPVSVPDASTLDDSRDDYAFPNTLEGIHPALADLMRANRVLPGEIQQVVAQKGYLPLDMPVSQYPADFVEGCLVAAWPAVLECVEKDRKLPF